MPRFTPQLIARRGLTLIEALVAIAVVAVLIALICPAILSSREVARRSLCRNNLKQLGLALHNYENVNRMFPAGWIGAIDGQPQVFGPNGLGWGPGVLPYLEKSLAYNKIHFQEHIGNPSNDGFRESIRWNHPVAFVCPTDSDLPLDLVWKTTWQERSVVMPVSSYVGVFGTDGLDRCPKQLNQQCVGNGAFYHNSFLKISDFRDGTANTCMLGERRSRPGDREPWYSTWAGVVPDDDRSLFRLLGTGEHAPGDRKDTIADFSSSHCWRSVLPDG